MSTCLELDLAFPPVPGVFIAPSLVPPFFLPATVDVWCCRFSVPDFLGINVAIAALNALIVAAGGEANAIIAMVEAEVLAAAAPLLKYAIAVKLNCPLE